MSLYQRIAEQLQYIAPRFYKERYFKKLKNLSWENYSGRNIEPELLWITDYLTPDDVFFDIGANTGSFIFQLEKKLSPKNIFAFEPNNKLYLRLKRIFPEVAAYPIALSDKNGTAEFKVPVIHGKTVNSRGTLQLEYRETDEGKNYFQTVQVSKLDDWVFNQKIEKIDFIKIDVEGNERETLNGSAKVIAKYRPTLMVEIEQRHHSEPISQLIEEIESRNYETFFLNRSTFTLQKLLPDMMNKLSSTSIGSKEDYINNFIFVPKKAKKEEV
ncbi:MAG: FkbM family methyltransferase [Weeksellaceae bacterium]|nr:FkbM family methyltransferase [Bacteroidota bacterium]MCG2780603.1 FkbM family methyltransferase [Weeksellaceae bacterium]